MEDIKKNSNTFTFINILLAAVIDGSPHNIRLTCVCAFADAHSDGKVGAKVA